MQDFEGYNAAEQAGKFPLLYSKLCKEYENMLKHDEPITLSVELCTARTFSLPLIILFTQRLTTISELMMRSPDLCLQSITIGDLEAIMLFKEFISGVVLKIHTEAAVTALDKLIDVRSSLIT